jgi:hypothetical protein
MQTASPAPLLTNASTKAVTLPTPKHWQDRSAWTSVRDDSRHSAVVGRSGRGAPSVVDRGALHHRLGSLRAGRGPDVHGGGRTAGHRAHVPSDHGSSPRWHSFSTGRPSTSSSLASAMLIGSWSGPQTLAGWRPHCSSPARLVQLEHWERAADQPQRSRCRPAGVAPRHVRLRRVPGCQRTGLGGGASRRRRGRTRPNALADRGRQPARLDRLRDLRRGRLRRPRLGEVWHAELSSLGTLVGALCFLLGAVMLLPRPVPRTAPGMLPALSPGAVVATDHVVSMRGGRR